MDAGAPLPTYINDLQVSDWLGVTPGLVRRWAKRGKIPAMILPDGSMLFDPAELARWVMSLPRGGSATPDGEVAA